jgi:hypothetical protein
MPSSTIDAGRVRCVADRHDTDARTRFLALRAKGWSLGRIAEPLQWNLFPPKTSIASRRCGGAKSARSARRRRGWRRPLPPKSSHEIAPFLPRFCLEKPVSPGSSPRDRRLCPRGSSHCTTLHHFALLCSDFTNPTRSQPPRFGRTATPTRTIRPFKGFQGCSKEFKQHFSASPMNALFRLCSQQKPPKAPQRFELN